MTRESNPHLKIQLCRHFTDSGFCSWGERCRYAHGLEQLRGGLASRGTVEGVEAFLRRIRSQEEKEGSGEAAVVEVVKHNT